MYRKFFSLFSIVVVLAMAFSVVSPVAAQPSFKSDKGGNVGESYNGVYLVQMANEPVVAYKGDIKGLKATAPKAGQKIDPNSSDVINYVAYLNGKHDEALAKVGGGQKLYDYNYTFNGFAAKLSVEQANKLASMNGVLAVSSDELQTMDTSSTPDFLGLTDPEKGLWAQLGGVGSAGEGIIIGIIDSGIWPENASFSDRTGWNGNETQDGKLDYQQIPGWHGKCTPGEDFNASMCNQKLIGAQWFNAGQGGDAGIDADKPWEFNSPRDYNGHGSHTASTAGGNNGVQVTGPASVFGTISGIAPRARIAMYKALWSTEAGDTAGGTTSDLVAAIDQAVADGVDVINYSISGSRTNFRDPAEIAFMYAADAGVFVATSAGNSGPTTSTVAHPGPWVTTVAAGTHDRYYEAEVTLGNGVTYKGASVNMTGAGPAPFIDSESAGLPGADPTAVRLCYAAVDNGGVAVLDPAKVAGKIVLCDRGVTARVNKSLAVYEAGGVGMVLVNTSSNSLNGDFHIIPTVHLSHLDRLAVKAYAATAGATAQIFPSYFTPTPAPYTASFSSRGPLQASGDLLKPDVIAPGQDILAAVSPMTSGGIDYALYSGTSMSSPHVAGLAALLKDLHPDWTPMMIKSALMTSAYDILDGPNTNPAVIFRQGAGHVRPNSAADPGLVYNSTWNNWLAFICATQPQGLDATCNALWNRGYSKNASDFNGASIAIGDLAGVETVKRTVTNVSGKKLTVNAGITGMTGIDVMVSPASLTLNPGQSGSFTVTFTTKANATLNAYTGGYLTWSGGGYSVRSPIVVRPVALAAPTQVSGTYNVIFGYEGPFTATARGLVPATTFNGSISNGEFLEYEMVIPAGTTYARVSLFDDNVSPDSDLDLYLFNSAGTQVGYSGSGTSAEEINLTNPAAGTYYILVEGYATANPSTFTGFYWTLGTDAAGNMTVTAPASATIGGTGTIALTFGSLPSGKYLGSIVYGGATGMPAPTIVRYDVP